MWRERWNSCRFCKGPMVPSDELVKYGTRHYAHPRCYFDAGKPLAALPLHEIEKLPYFLLKERGLLDQAQELTKRRWKA
jgi:hypothetical protein